MKNDNQKISLENFEALTEESNGTLINGFSEAFESSNDTLIGGWNLISCTANNCSGGNCVTGCGAK
jgi:hypothetical protein